MLFAFVHLKAAEWDELLVQGVCGLLLWNPTAAA